jgi:hypothetical protein
MLSLTFSHPSSDHEQRDADESRQTPDNYGYGSEDEGLPEGVADILQRGMAIRHNGQEAAPDHRP